MCGIAGILDAKQTINPDRLKKVMQHRGPDGFSFFSEESTSLFHAHLRIIGLNPCSAQPFSDDEKKFILVYNGAVYNYAELAAQYSVPQRYTKCGDTGVLFYLLKEKGAEILPELNGMFAFAFYNTVTKKLLAARDRFGVKPFYYSLYKEQFMFASEIKFLWQMGIPKVAKKNSWASYFMHDVYGTIKNTFWDQIYALAPGYYAEWHQSKFSEHKWYSFREAVSLQQAYPNADSLTPVYEEKVSKSVYYRFQADQKIGIALSGGLDSTLLFQTCNKMYPHKADFNCFTFNTGNTSFDEIPLSVKHIGHPAKDIVHCSINVQDVPALASKMAWHQDEPYGGIPTLAYSMIFEQANANGTKVILDGQGIDEAWAGYDYYQTENTSLIQGIEKSADHKDYLQPDFADFAESPVFDDPFTDNLLNKQYRDICFTKIPRSLRFNDRASMMHGIELREPFLDHTLLELAFAQHEHLKIKNDTGKYFIRKYAQQRFNMPQAFSKKRVLQTPQTLWLQNDLKEWVYDEISALVIRVPEWFQKGKVEKKLHKFFSAPASSSFEIWKMINTALIFNRQ